MVIQPGPASDSASSPWKPTGMPTPSTMRQMPEGTVVSGTRYAAHWIQRGTDDMVPAFVDCRG